MLWWVFRYSGGVSPFAAVAMLLAEISTESKFLPIWGDSRFGSDPEPRPDLDESDEEERQAETIADAADQSDQQAAQEAEHHPKGRRLRLRRHCHRPPPGSGPRVSDLAAELIPETRWRWRFSAPPIREFATEASVLVRYRAQTLGILRQTQRGARARDVFARYPGYRTAILPRYTDFAPDFGALPT